MLAGGKWLGINAPWVYPFPALVPLIAAHLVWPSSYLVGWLIFAIAINQAALSWLVLRNREATVLGWYWLGATIALGSVSLSRLDGISVSIALVGLSFWMQKRVSPATAWLTIAVWLKVWPVAVLGAMLFGVRRVGRVVATGAITSAAVLAIGFLLGGNGYIFGFILAQGDRGIQIESMAAMPWMWSAAFNQTASIYYDGQWMTYQVQGIGTDLVALAATPVMVLVMLATATLALVARRRGSDSGHLLSLVSFAFTLELIVFNKVGSPQYLGWLILPVLLGMLHHLPGWNIAKFGVLAVTALTQLIYPVMYDHLTAAQPLAIAILTARNLLELGLLVWVLWRLVRLVGEKQTEQVSNDFVLD
jgi:hypothetical protein